jgi:hypothetical protein
MGVKLEVDMKVLTLTPFSTVIALKVCLFPQNNRFIAPKCLSSFKTIKNAVRNCVPRRNQYGTVNMSAETADN